MSSTIPNLWPEQFNVEVQTPYTILKVQAGLLGKVTRGILEGVVETETAKETVQHRLVVIAPAVDSYRHTLIVAKHKIRLPYPSEVVAEALGKSVEHKLPGRPNSGFYTMVYPEAYDDEQMLQLVQKALRSSQTTAIILSLIARSNEARSATRSLPSVDSAEGKIDEGDGLSSPDDSSAGEVE